MAGLDLSTIATFSTALAVVIALVFGVVQVRHQNQRRREELALDAVHQILAPEVLAAIHAVLEFPDDLGEDGLAKRAADDRAAVGTVDFTYESIGWMVQRRMVDLHDIDDLMGGVARAVWHKVARIAAERRTRSNRPNEFEWLQWLAERLEQDPSPGKAAGAHVTHAAWRR